MLPENAPSEIRLSPLYRHAQRVTARWLEHASQETVAFAVAAAWNALGIVEYHRLARWLAWQCLARASQGDHTLLARIMRLDAALGQAIQRTAHRLPGAYPALRERLLPLSA